MIRRGRQAGIKGERALAKASSHGFRYRAMKTVIVAAGRGSRLLANTDDRPKTLLPLGEGTILSAILTSFRQAGCAEFVIVTGYHGDQLARFAATPPPGLRITTVENREWSRGNGLSVYAARAAVGDAPFLLSMSDHLVSPAALRAVRDAPPGPALLLVDPRIDEVVDLDDATKVWVEERQITRIGKELTDYNAVDCGVFRLDARFFAAMETALAGGREGISDAMRELIAAGALAALPLPAGAEWVDIDTPEAYAHARAHLAAYR
jgi:choline kinase